MRGGVVVVDGIERAKMKINLADVRLPFYTFLHIFHACVVIYIIASSSQAPVSFAAFSTSSSGLVLMCSAVVHSWVIGTQCCIHSDSSDGSEQGPLFLFGCKMSFIFSNVLASQNINFHFAETYIAWLASLPDKFICFESDENTQSKFLNYPILSFAIHDL